MTWIASLATGAWLAILCFYVSGIQTNIGWLDKLLKLPPNEFGDFLSGAFAPVAFAWLAYSVIMQRQELALQRNELSETREVLKAQENAQNRSAAQASELAQISQKQLSLGYKRDVELAVLKWINSLKSIVYFNKELYFYTSDNQPKMLWNISSEIILGEPDIFVERLRRVVGEFVENNPPEKIRLRSDINSRDFIYRNNFEVMRDISKSIRSASELYNTNIELVSRDRTYINVIELNKLMSHIIEMLSIDMKAN